FMTGNLDRVGIASESVNVQKAKAITRGVAEYFKQIYIEMPKEPEPPVSSTPPVSSSQPPVSSSEPPVSSQQPAESEPEPPESEPQEPDDEDDTVPSQSPTSSQEQTP
ncbi:MAG: hypothetical protein UHE86_04645, partial [Acutalibacteraceae bacterium]|nr:hypothetical protein [Acutalibacteraceae bacterium]